ncbi:hypothetical protein AAE478_001606 [Parahypoxylon ruwenzoriense]
MGIRDLLRKKDQLDESYGADRETLDRLAGPEFTFIRSDTHTQEIIHPPSEPHDRRAHSHHSSSNFLTAKDAGSSPSRARRSLDVFRPRSRDNNSSSDGREGHGRISQRFHLSSSSSSSSRNDRSEYVPDNLPQINVVMTPADSGDGPRTRGRAGDGQGGGEGRGGVNDGYDKDAYERQWEKRATMLAETNERQRSRSPSGVAPSPGPSSRAHSPARAPGGGGAAGAGGVVSSKVIDQQIQEAIRFHEEGQLDQSTLLFGRLADPHGANNPLSQVLYGLALRHGWGCEPDPERAVSYLSAAASNAAAVESMALQAGMKKGGAAKGELVLAIFELANCFRHGWGIPRDPVAAKQVGRLPVTVPLLM